MFGSTNNRVQSRLLRVFLLQLVLISVVTVIGVITASLIVDGITVLTMQISLYRRRWILLLICPLTSKRRYRIPIANSGWVSTVSTMKGSVR